MAVEEILDQANRDKHRLYLSAVNWAEIYFNTVWEVSREAAEAQAQSITNLPIDVIGVGDDFKLARQAAVLKAIYR